MKTIKYLTAFRAALKIYRLPFSHWRRIKVEAINGKFLKMPFILTMVWSLAVSAQSETATSGQPEMADALRSNGKIYVVVTALVIIFIGIVIYLFALNAKLNRLEKLLKDKNKSY